MERNWKWLNIMCPEIFSVRVEKMDYWYIYDLPPRRVFWYLFSKIIILVHSKKTSTDLLCFLRKNFDVTVKSQIESFGENKFVNADISSSLDSYHTNIVFIRWKI